MHLYQEGTQFLKGTDILVIDALGLSTYNPLMLLWDGVFGTGTCKP